MINHNLINFPRGLQNKRKKFSYVQLLYKLILEGSIFPATDFVLRAAFQRRGNPLDFLMLSEDSQSAGQGPAAAGARDRPSFASGFFDCPAEACSVLSDQELRVAKSGKQ